MFQRVTHEMSFGQHEGKIRLYDRSLSYGVIQFVLCLVFHFAAGPKIQKLGLLAR